MELVPSSGGVFEVMVREGKGEERLLHSKKATGRFPTDEAVLEALRR